MGCHAQISGQIACTCAQHIYTIVMQFHHLYSLPYGFFALAMQFQLSSIRESHSPITRRNIGG